MPPILLGQLRARRKGAALYVLETNDDAPFAAVLDLEHLDDGTFSLLDLVHDALVNLEGVVAGLLEEAGVGDGPDLGRALFSLLGGLGRERAAGDEVASELLRDSRRDGAC